MKINKFSSVTALGVAALLFVNCQNDSISEEVVEELSKSNTSSEKYPLASNEQTVIKPFFGTETEFSQVDGNLVLGDMILSPEQVEETNDFQKGTILNNSSRRWPKSGNTYVVPYVIDSRLPNKGRVTNAMNHWKNKTRVRFVKRTNQRNYVYFTDDGGCYSYIGKIGGRQTISLGSGCTTGNTIHEIGHAVGMFHEQSHPRRDRNVTINFQNIQSGREGNFRKESSSNVKTTNFDLGSVMMYGSYFFSKNGKPTIVRKNGSTFNVQRNGLSNRDVRVVNKIYK